MAKPTVAYLWARTVTCKNCRATVPLLKTRWLCKKDNKRVLLTMEPNADKTGVVFGIETDVPVKGGNAAQTREHDKRIGAGTMSRSGATVSVLRHHHDDGGHPHSKARSGRLGSVMTAVVVDGPNGKEYRLPTAHEIAHGRRRPQKAIPSVFAQIPFGYAGGTDTEQGGTRIWRRAHFTASTKWQKLFTPRQLLALGHVREAATRAARDDDEGGELLRRVDRGIDARYLACWLLTDSLDCLQLAVVHVGTIDATRCVNRHLRSVCLPDYLGLREGNPLRQLDAGAYALCLEWIATVLEHATVSAHSQPVSADDVAAQSCTESYRREFDLVVTDPPYYDAIPYSDLMDFFYVWLRRTLNGLSPELDSAFHRATFSEVGPPPERRRTD